MRLLAAALALVFAVVGAGQAHASTFVSRYSIDSRYAHHKLRQITLAPDDGAQGRPLLVFLHGRGSGPASNLNDAFVSALEAQGARAPAVVFPSGGDHSYWHRRRGGDWARYVLREVIPRAVRRLHADPERVAIGGISMGGNRDRPQAGVLRGRRPLRRHLALRGRVGPGRVRRRRRLRPP